MSKKSYLCENCDHSCHCSNGSKCPSCPCMNCVHDKQRAEEYYASLINLGKHRD